MLRTRQKSDYLKNKYFYLDKYRNNRVVRCILNILLCPDMIVNDFELIQTMHLNAKLKTVNRTKYIKDAIFTYLCGHDQCTEP